MITRKLPKAAPRAPRPQASRESARVAHAKAPDDVSEATRTLPTEPVSFAPFANAGVPNVGVPNASPHTTHARLSGHSIVDVRGMNTVKHKVDAVRDDVLRFLDDHGAERFQVGVRRTAAPLVNLAAQGVAFTVNTVGDGVDHVADKLVHTGESREVLADLGREKLQAGALDLHARGFALSSAASRKLEQAHTLSDVERNEAAQAWSTGEVLQAIGHKLASVVVLPEARAFCAYGGSALFHTAGDVADVVGEVLHQGAHAASAFLRFGGRVLQKVLGSDTLRHTSLAVSGGARVHIGAKNFNAGVSGTVVFPSVAVKDAHPDAEYADVVGFDWGVGASTPIGGVSVNSKQGFGVAVNLYFVSASMTDTSERLFVGIPGLWGVTVGRHAERGSELNISGNIGLSGGPAFGAYLTEGVSVYSPLLDPVNKYVTRPIVTCIVKGMELASRTVRFLGDAVSSSAGV
jgi:hypothetical protein